MADGKILYEVRADDSKVVGDINAINSKVEGAAGKIAGGLKRIIGTIGIGYLVKEIGKLGTEFEQTMAKASTLFGDVAVDTDNLSKKILDLSSRTGVDAAEIGEALYSALSAGIPATEDMGVALGFLESSARLAKAGFTDVDTAMQATVKTLNAYGLEAEDAERIQRILIQTQNKGITTVDELGGVLAQVTPTAAALGVNFETVGAALATMTAQGTPTAQATTQLNALLAELAREGTKGSKALAKATEGTKYAGKGFQELVDEGVPLNEILQLMRDYAESNGTNMLSMFRSIESGRAALQLTGDGATIFADNLAAMGTQVDVVGEAYDKVTNTSGERFKRMLETLKNAGIELFAAFEPILSALLPPLIDLFNELSPIIELLSPLFSMLAQIVSGVVTAAFSGLRPIIESLKTLLKGIVDFIGGVFSEDWSRAWSGVVGIFKGIWSGILGFLQGIINGAIDVINAFINTFNNTVGKVTGKIQTIRHVTLVKTDVDWSAGEGKTQTDAWTSMEGSGGAAVRGSTGRSYAIGTRYIQEDQRATVHAGESIFSKWDTRRLLDAGVLGGLSSGLTDSGGKTVINNTNYAFNSPVELDERAIRQRMLLAQQRERLLG